MNKVFDPKKLETDEGMGLPDLMKKKRAELGMTQADLADATGISLSGIKQYESGRSEPTLPKIQAIAKALDLSAGEAMSGLPFGDPSFEQQKMEAMRQATAFIMGEPSPAQLTGLLDYIRSVTGADVEQDAPQSALNRLSEMRLEGRKGRPVIKALNAALDQVDELNMQQLDELAYRFDVDATDAAMSEGLEDRLIIAALYGVDLMDLDAVALEAIRAAVDPEEKQIKERESFLGMGESTEDFVLRMVKELPSVMIEQCLEGSFVPENLFPEGQ